ncbi:hypothetical protein BC939DRAFT_19576 [Gamsiella multidivaricata]|uniref:uncharacterized protein n=1 Tax=Gamsiella multidivaricata TaxID=101098 RepID=UPI00221FE469|nr:uncharacterized protein BC939DRAFT_19576 [Gamsiella multidivaricata]KAI7817014.1 hypothetical protein BC939DRAFT_19576 [Gamsiella multidivaricata]
MIKNLQDMPRPFGGTMRELIEASPKHSISKIFFELFKTWYHSRTVLLGDVCHKMTPAAGQGAVNAMQDAVVLAKCIFSMPDSSSESIIAAFTEYFSQRYHRAEAQFARSNTMSKITSGQTWTERLIRYIMFNYIPTWLQQRGFAKTFEYRPQVAWLPLVENRGTGHILPQEGPRSVTQEQTRLPHAAASVA